MRKKYITKNVDMKCMPWNSKVQFTKKANKQIHLNK